MSNVKICSRCQKEISESERKLEVNTWIGKRLKRADWFHWNCWLLFIKEIVQSEQQKIIKNAFTLAGNILAKTN